MFCITVLLLVATAAQADDAPPPVTGNPLTRDIMDYGAYTDGTRDNTAIFQEALDTAHAVGGGIVEVPSGRYRFEGSITIPSNVTLRGTFIYAPAHAGIRDVGAQERPVYGSVLEPVGGADDPDGEPFITLQGNAVIQGFTIHYTEQDPHADAPTPYPYTIAMRGNNPAAIELQLLNPFKAIDASRNQRALIRNIHGQPIYIGVYVDAIYDIGRIENVHWNPWWSFRTKVYQWQQENGIGFIFGKTDWHYVHNTFCFGYKVGYKFIETDSGATNGNFLGIGADDCYTALVVEQSEPMGLLITNGEFVSFRGPDPTMIRVEDTHTGTVRFVNCAFWGPARRNAVIDGHGTVGFSDCTFMQWGYEHDGERHNHVDLPSIEVLGGSILVRGCEFLDNKTQVHLGPDVERAIVTDNLVTGDVRIERDAPRRRTVIRDNLGFPKDRDFTQKLPNIPGFRANRLRATP